MSFLLCPFHCAFQKRIAPLADCDVILACADKPIARDLVNHLAVCHLIPVIEAGVALRSRDGGLHKGHIVSQVVTPDSRCLRCTNQYTTDQVSLELEGLLEDPEYIRTLPAERRPNTANIFPASLVRCVTASGPIYSVGTGSRVVAAHLSTAIPSQCCLAT